MSLFKALASLSLLTILLGCTITERPQDITLAGPATDASSTQTSAFVSRQAQEVNSPEAPSPRAATVPSKVNETKKDSISSKAPQYRIVNIVRTKPDCKGSDCPSITLKRLSFDGYDRFNAFLETSLVNMAQVETNQAKVFRNLADLSSHFWKTAENRYEIVLGTSVKRATPEIVVIALDSYIFSGGAHGMSTMQYINWLPKLDRIVTLEEMLLPGQLKAFEAVLRKQHRRWLETNEFAKADQASYEKMWPFQFSDNAALLDSGIAITYDPYMLGPYALGMPTIAVPFAELKGIVNPALLARLKTP